MHCGNCDIGCPVDARNTLDRTYLARAETKGAEVRPLHLVTSIAQQDGTQQRQRLEGRFRPAGERHANPRQCDRAHRGGGRRIAELDRAAAAAPRCAGARCPTSAIGSAAIGEQRDFLTPAYYTGRKPEPTQGPTITSAIDFLDGSKDGQRFWIEDGGFPNLLANMAATATSAHPQAQAFLNWARIMLQQHGGLPHIMPWFAQGVDAGNGRLSLRPKGLDRRAAGSFRSNGTSPTRSR